VISPFVTKHPTPTVRKDKLVVVRASFDCEATNSSVIPNHVPIAYSKSMRILIEPPFKYVVEGIHLNGSDEWKSASLRRSILANRLTAESQNARHAGAIESSNVTASVKAD
jgi:hypothetical protein